jgi:hypothetical protein
MKLQNVLPHMANGSVLVNGHQYELDAQGVVLSDMTAEDARKLLTNRAAWRIAIERQVVTPEPVAPERPITVPDAREPVAFPPVPEPLPVSEFRSPVNKFTKKK